MILIVHLHWPMSSFIRDSRTMHKTVLIIGALSIVRYIATISAWLNSVFCIKMQDLLLLLSFCDNAQKKEEKDNAPIEILSQAFIAIAICQTSWLHPHSPHLKEFSVSLDCHSCNSYCDNVTNKKDNTPKKDNEPIEILAICQNQLFSPALLTCKNSLYH